MFPCSPKPLGDPQNFALAGAKRAIPRGQDSPLGYPIRTQDSLHLVRSRRQPYNKSAHSSICCIVNFSKFYCFSIETYLAIDATSYGITTCVSLPLFWRSGNIYSVNCYSLRPPADPWLFLSLRPVTPLLLFFQSPWMAQWVAPGMFTSKGLNQNFPLASLTCFPTGFLRAGFLSGHPSSLTRCCSNIYLLHLVAI